MILPLSLLIRVLLKVFLMTNMGHEKYLGYTKSLGHDVLSALLNKKNYSKWRNQIYYFVEQVEAHRIAYIKSDFHKSLVELELVY